MRITILGAIFLAALGLSAGLFAQEEAPPESQSPIEAPPTNRESRDSLASLEASPAGEGILVVYAPVSPSVAYVLYRSAEPIDEAKDLLNSVIVRSLSRSPYMDYPAPGLSYYYALIPQEDLISGNVEIMPGFNATVNPVAVPGGNSPPPPIRSIPLPLLAPLGLGSGEVPTSSWATPRKVPLSAEAQNAMADVRPAPARPRSRGAALPDVPPNREDPLTAILLDALEQGDWLRAQEEFRAFLVLPKLRDEELRARLYLGLSYYMGGSYREALLEFLTLNPGEESNRWIQLTLEALACALPQGSQERP